MESFYAETVMQEDGKLALRDLPFRHGQTVQVFISAREHGSFERHPLRGTVLKYERPFDPVAQGEWTDAQ